MMKKGFLIALLGFMGCCSSLAGADSAPFSISYPVVQSMVPGSSQLLNYTLSTESTESVNIHCSFSSSNPNLTGDFGGNGCTSAGGVGIYKGAPDQIQLTLSASSAATGDITGTLTFQKTNGRPYSKVITIPIYVPSSTNRIITFKNYCPFSVVFGASSSSVPAKNNGTFHACSTDSDCSAYTYSSCVGGYCGGGACDSDSDCLNTNSGTCAVPAGSAATTHASCTYCSTDSDCLEGSQCNVDNHMCYWSLPAPADASTNHYTLAPYSGSGAPSSDSVTIQDHSSTNGYQLMWGGGFAGRTHCIFDNTTHQFSCKVANCNTNGAGDGNGGCALGEGFDAPSTQAEVTFVSTTPDTYDITLINGISVPTQMGVTPEVASPAPFAFHWLPEIVSAKLSATSASNPYNNPYICGTPGSNEASVTSNGTIGACPWSVTPPASSVAYRWVDTDNGTMCTNDTTCEAINSAYRCGLSVTQIGTSPSSGSGATVCGTALGYWNQNEICAQNASFNVSGLVNCTAGSFGGNSLINLLQCTGDAATSCYNVGAANSTCCGCTNWQNQGIAVPTNPAIVSQCSFPNSNWGGGTYPNNTGQVLPGLVWLKQTCPSSYVYPFDDKSSTFTCPSNNGQSAVDYTVTFCPGQETAGLPSGS